MANGGWEKQSPTHLPGVRLDLPIRSLALPPTSPPPQDLPELNAQQQLASVHFMATIRGMDLPLYRSRQRVLVAVLSGLSDEQSLSAFYEFASALVGHL